MSAPKLKIMDLLREKSNKMNDKLQRLQSDLSRALKVVLISVAATGTNDQTVHHEIKIKKIISGFWSEMNELEGKYINLCQSALTTMNADDEQMSLHGSSDEYIDSEDENTSNHHNSTETESVINFETYCELCHHDYKKPSVLKEHQLSVHSKARPFHCPECPTAFKLNKHLMHHIREVHDGYPYSCNRCGKRFKKSRTLRQHERSHNTRHQRFDSNPEDEPPTINDLQCEHCEWVANRRRDLYIHIRSVHNLPPFKCDVSGCGAAFHWNKDFRQHQRTHFSGTVAIGNHCEICNKDFSRTSALRDHYRRYHSDVRPYQCSECTDTFALQWEWAVHVRDVHNGYPYPCNQCDQRFQYNKELRSHQDSHKTRHQPRVSCALPQRSKNLQCPHCGKICCRTSDVYDHIRKIHDLPPFKCDLAGCGATFYWNKELKKHQSSHFSHFGGSDRNLKDDSNIPVDRPRKRRRLRADSDDRSFACHLCAETFIIERKLVAHLLNSHQMIPPSCNVCHRGFARKMDLEEHRRHCSNAEHVDGDADHEGGMAVKEEVEGLEMEREVEEQGDGLRERKIHLIRFRKHTEIPGARDSFDKGSSRNSDSVLTKDRFAVPSLETTEQAEAVLNALMAELIDTSVEEQGHMLTL